MIIVQTACTWCLFVLPFLCICQADESGVRHCRERVRKGHHETISFSDLISTLKVLIFTHKFMEALARNKAEGQVGARLWRVLQDLLPLENGRLPKSTKQRSDMIRLCVLEKCCSVDPNVTRRVTWNLDRRSGRWEKGMQSGSSYNSPGGKTQSLD